jgi:hypothetical protein
MISKKFLKSANENNLPANGRKKEAKNLANGAGESS